MKCECIKDFPVTTGGPPLLKKGEFYEADVSKKDGLDVYSFLDGKVKFSGITIRTYMRFFVMCQFKNCECEHAGSLKAYSDYDKKLVEWTMCYNDEIQRNPEKCPKPWPASAH